MSYVIEIRLGWSANDRFAPELPDRDYATLGAARRALGDGRDGLDDRVQQVRVDIVNTHNGRRWSWE